MQHNLYIIKEMLPVRNGFVGTFECLFKSLSGDGPRHRRVCTALPHLHSFLGSHVAVRADNDAAMVVPDDAMSRLRG